jgi:hypothetical protein
MSESANLIDDDFVDFSKLIDSAGKFEYEMPRWLLNDNIYDQEWLASKVAIDIDYYRKNKNKALKINFKRKISDVEYLTDGNNEPLLKDIMHSLLYLDARGKITRPLRAKAILVAITDLIKHANEVRQKKSRLLVRGLDQIKLNELKDFIMDYNTQPHVFAAALKIIDLNYGSSSRMDWIKIKNELNLTTRSLMSLQHSLKKHYKSNPPKNDKSSYQEDHSVTKKWNQPNKVREFQPANTMDFDIDTDLQPSEKTISNIVSLLEAVYTARASQKYKFAHSPAALFSNGETLFDSMRQSIKTPIMPTSNYLHSISTSLKFARKYGYAIRQHLSVLAKNELKKVDNSDVYRSSSSLQEEVFKETPLPDVLKELNITSWCDDNLVCFSQFRREMSMAVAIRLYLASIYILVAGFVASRVMSMRSLKRNCFVQSPIDGLFDLVLRIPKTSERIELEDVHRPIPDLIFDYGLEFALLNNVLEERRGFIVDENEQFLFGGFLSHTSFKAYTSEFAQSRVTPLSDDYINGCLDLFADWSFSPLINGKRWYPRSHQYRRTFAVLYFNMTDNTGLEELSWFLGHADLEQTFHYAEVSPSSEWIDEAEVTIARIGASLGKAILGDSSVTNIVNTARKKAKTSLVIEPLVRDLIDEHKKNTGETVRFHRIEGNAVFFYFQKKEAY